jgi:hypothetical protein
VEVTQTSLNPGQKVARPILAIDRLGRGFSTWTPPSPRKPRPMYPLINMWIAASPSSQAGNLSRESGSSLSDGRFKDALLWVDRMEEETDDRDVREGVLLVAWDNSISSSS